MKAKVLFTIGVCVLVLSGAMALGQVKPAGAIQNPAALRTKGNPRAVIARLEQVIPELMKDGRVPGLSIALLRNDELVWHKGFGVKNTKTNEPVTDTTVFEAASLSKPVFAYAVLKLVDAGKFDLDKPLNQYLPGNYDVGDDARLGQITARRVLSHTSGFPNWRQGGALKIYFTPGDRFSYSGEGFVYLSKVIEKVTGETFNDFMKRMVFVPLGMTSSSYIWEDRYDSLKTFRHNTMGQPTGQNKPSRNQPPQANAAASLHTTAQDYGRFVAAVLKGTGLKKETLRQMLTPQINVSESGTNNTLKQPEKLSQSLGWGLGWGLQTTADGPAFWHWGDNGDSKAYIVAYPAQKAGVVFFANSATGLAIVREIVDAAMGGNQPALAWLKYEPYNSPGQVLRQAILAKGAAAALDEYRRWRQGRPAAELVTESQMNSIGYELIRINRLPDSLEVFKLNVEDYPQSSNAYDSLGEAYMTAGNNELAIKNYQRSVELNPGNEGGKEALQKLQKKN